LAEEDEGGFGDFMQALWEKVGAEVVTAVGAAVGAAIGTAVGTCLAGIIGTIVGAVVGAIIGWLINLVDNPDDLISVQTWILYLASDTQASFNGLDIHGPVAPPGGDEPDRRRRSLRRHHVLEGLQLNLIAFGQRLLAAQRP
jgi:hypothetical protein